jgi:hypothetical protein
VESNYTKNTKIEIRTTKRKSLVVFSFFLRVLCVTKNLMYIQWFQKNSLYLNAEILKFEFIYVIINLKKLFYYKVCNKIKKGGY